MQHHTKMTLYKSTLVKYKILILNGTLEPGFRQI